MAHETPSFNPDDSKVNTPDQEIRRNIHTETPQLNERRTGDYQHFLGFDINDLGGQTVANIGAGGKGYFDKEASKKADRFVSVSPYFSDKGLGGKLMRKEYSPGKISRFIKAKINKEKLPIPVTALAEQLPFQDKTFDKLLALYSVPLYTERENFDRLFPEIVRVLKDGGTAHLYPIARSDLPEIERILSDKNISINSTPLQELEDKTGVENPHQVIITRNKKIAN